MDGSKVVEIKGRGKILSIAFLDNSHIITGGSEGIIRRWEVEDGSEVGEGVKASLEGEYAASISAIAISKNRNRMVAGTYCEATVWNTETREKVASLRHSNWVDAVDVSPDSTKVATGSKDKTAAIWNIETGERLVGPLSHEKPVAAVRFSPNGDLLVTATCGPDQNFIQVFESRDGTSLFSIPFKIRYAPTTPLAWTSDGQKIFAVSSRKIKCIDVSTKSVSSEWSSSQDKTKTKTYPSIILASSGKFVISSANLSVSFWDASTHLQLCTPIKRPSEIRSIALSHDDGYLAVGESDDMITIHSLRGLFPWYYYPVDKPATHDAQIPLLHLHDSVLLAWVTDNLVKVEELLTEEITQPISRWHILPYHLFANRALVRLRSNKSDEAYKDAEESIKNHPSPVGHVAKAMSLGSKGEVDAAMREFDLAFCCCDPSEAKLLLLIKAIVLFKSLPQKHQDAILRIQALIKTANYEAKYLCNQVLGKMYMTKREYQHAVEAFEDAKLHPPSKPDTHLTAISLIFGLFLDPDNLGMNLSKALLAAGRTKKAADTLRRMSDTSGTSKIPMTWINDLKKRCVENFEHDGDAAMKSCDYDLAITHYSDALSIHAESVSVLVQRSKAHAKCQSWDQALQDANKAVDLDPSSPWGYERKHAALHGLQKYDEAIDAVNIMLSKITSSPDQNTRSKGTNYIMPSARAKGIHKVIRNFCPLVLINLRTGRLCHTSDLIQEFESHITYKELISATTTSGDEADRLIKEVVEGFFQYVMFSHVWDGKEPSFQDVSSVKSVWDLEPTPSNDKLRKFCETVRDNGFWLCWSDTCCIDKTLPVVLNQSIRSMFTWYQHSAATYVFLSGAASPGDLKTSRWMTRAWTAQELLAPKVIRFYDREWKLYLNDTIQNHKTSPVIMNELVASINIPSEIIASFQPDNLKIGVRGMLRISSLREATLEEDLAYSLIGVFKINITAQYGEGREFALGRLLEKVVASTGDVTLLAWTGKSSEYNSCLPSTLSVYSRSPHCPPLVQGPEMTAKTRLLEQSKLPVEKVSKIYDAIMALPTARFHDRRLHLPCIVFSVSNVRHLGTDVSRSGQLHTTYRATVSILGDVEFSTADDLSSHGHPDFLVHPWIRDLLPASDWPHPHHELNLRRGSVDPKEERDERYQRALRLLVRLEQPFSALLLRRRGHKEFERVVADREIIVKGPTINASSKFHINALTVEIR